MVYFKPKWQLSCEDSGEGFDTNWDGPHDSGVMGRGGYITLSENALSVWVFLNNLH